ncbi:MAG: hypothetical protein AAFX81_19930 [Pseudomonadota bacterium]
MRWFWFLVVLGLVGTAQAADTHVVADGSYVARPPATWDGETPLALLVFFHGYSATGEAITSNPGLQRLADRHDALLVAPNGLAGANGRTSWSHQGSPMQVRDEHGFVKQVLADVAVRYPLRAKPPTFAGFSQGGSMVWDLACSEGAALGRYVAISGGFWEPMPAACVTPVGSLAHVHGTSDTVVPMAGRPIGGRWRQGDIEQGWTRFETAAGCQGAPRSNASLDGLRCRQSTDCADGDLLICLHDGGHDMDLTLLDRALGTAP